MGSITIYVHAGDKHRYFSSFSLLKLIITKEKYCLISKDVIRCSIYLTKKNLFVYKYTFCFSIRKLYFEL